MAAPSGGQFPQTMSQPQGSAAPFSSPGMVPQQSGQPSQIVSPTREINAVFLCKKGQECVGDVVQKAGEIFKLLQAKQLPLPNNVQMNAQMHQEKRAKLEEAIQQLQQNFQKLRILYDKALDITGTDDPPEEALVPLVGEPYEDILSPHPEQVYRRSRYYSEENSQLAERGFSVPVKLQTDLMPLLDDLSQMLKICSKLLLQTQNGCFKHKQLRSKNQQLKEIIDQMRTIIWEINTMMIMRKT